MPDALRGSMAIAKYEQAVFRPLILIAGVMWFTRRKTAIFATYEEARGAFADTSSPNLPAKGGA